MKQSITNDYGELSSFVTKDFSLFAFAEENRKVNLKKAVKVEASIEELKYLISPVVVTALTADTGLTDMEGEVIHGSAKKHIVIDGQHRLHICKKLNMPVLVVVNPRVPRKDIIAANNTGNDWGLMEYVNSYKKDPKKPEYATLAGLIAQYKEQKFTSSAVIEAFFVEATGGNKAAKAGTYQMNIVTGANIMTSCWALKEFFPKGYKELKVIRALKNIYARYPQFDISRVTGVLRENPELIGDDFSFYSTPSKDSQIILDWCGMSFPNLGVGADIPEDMKQFIRAYYSHTCNEAGCRKPDSNHVDHRIATENGGETAIYNLQLLCEPCNTSKQDRYDS